MKLRFSLAIMNQVWKCIACISTAGILFVQPSIGQSTWSLNDLSLFQDPGPNWQVAGGVASDLNKNEVLTTSLGSGILVNLPKNKAEAKDLISNFQHGDIDLYLEYLLPKGSNSGIYLQGRYEIQLLDSWGIKNPTPGDNGGIYERWDESRPEGQKGFDGHPPRQNVSRAPGLWQKLKVAFAAPVFNAGGQKIANARIIRLELNGVIIHENVGLAGVTRGAINNDEVAKGPLRIQGDHGPVAIRNIKTTVYDTPRPELADLKYVVYKGKYNSLPDFVKLPPEAQGTSVILTSNVSNVAKEFLVRYTGTLRVKEPGEYGFNLRVPGGSGYMKINDKVVIAFKENNSRVKVSLPAGDLPFELIYSKYFNLSNKSGLGLAISGPGFREYLISDAAVTSDEHVNSILVQATANTILRCFIDLPGYPRVVHAVSAGSPDKLHYTYDLDHGMLVQVWRGEFLDATPMWHERGDGSSIAMGAVQRFGKPVPAIEKLASPGAVWSEDTTNSGFRPKGYVVDDKDQPTFRYFTYGASVTDAIRVTDDGRRVHREIILQNPTGNLYFRLAEGSTIETLPDGSYLVDDKSYYLRIDETGGATPVIRDANGRKEMIIPIQNKLGYSIFF